MYVRSLRVQNVKLLRDVRIDFVDANGRPRMWTVFVGENRLCKTTLLQTIAAAACGGDRGTQLVTDVVASWPDLRKPVPLHIEAEFGFSDSARRTYPSNGVRVGPETRLWSTLDLEPRSASSLDDRATSASTAGRAKPTPPLIRSRRHASPRHQTGSSPVTAPVGFCPALERQLARRTPPWIACGRCSARA